MRVNCVFSVTTVNVSSSSSVTGLSVTVPDTQALAFLNLINTISSQKKEFEMIVILFKN